MNNRSVDTSSDSIEGRGNAPFRQRFDNELTTYVSLCPVPSARLVETFPALESNLGSFAEIVLRISALHAVDR